MRHARTSIAVLCLLFTALSSTPLSAQSSWTTELFAGTGWSANSPLTIWQVGQPDIQLMAHWETRPFTGAPYYALRVVHLRGDRGWAVDYTHHKLYLANTTAQVQQFIVGHGFNMLHLSRVWRTHGWLLSAGPGIVVTHPESKVRGLVLDPGSGGTLGAGYYLDGVSLLGAVGRRVSIAGPLFATGLAKVTLSSVTTRVRDGGAEVPNAAFHLNVGLGMKL